MKAGDLLLGLLGHLRKSLGLDGLLFLLLLRNGQRRLAGLGEARAELGQITAFAEELAARIHHFEVHAQMRLQARRRFSPGLL